MKKYSFAFRKQPYVSLVLAMTVFTSGCSLLSVYRIDIPQGTPLTQTQVQKVQVGMTVEQVKYLLGSPATVDGLTPRKWEYFYEFIPGTNGKRDKVPSSHRKERLSVYFSEKGIVENISGVNSIPAKQYAVPSSKN